MRLFLLWVFRNNLQKIAIVLSDISSLLQLYLLLPQFSKKGRLVIIISLQFFNLIELLLDPFEVLGSQMSIDRLIQHFSVVKRFFDGVVNSDMRYMLLVLVLVLYQAVLLLLALLPLEVVADRSSSKVFLLDVVQYCLLSLPVQTLQLLKGSLSGLHFI